MSDRIDRAFVEIIPDFSRFNREMRSGVGNALQQLQRNVRSAFTTLESDLRRVGSSATNELGRSFRTMSGNADAAASNIGRSFDTAASGIDDGFVRSGRDIERAFNSVENEASDTTQTIEREFSGAADSIDDDMDRAEREARDSFGSMSDDASREGDRIGAIMRRAAGVIAAAFAGIQITQWARDGVDAALDLERGLTEIVNVASAGVGDPQLFADLERVAGELALEFGVLSEDAIPAMYNAVSAGFGEIEQLEGLMETATKGAAVNLTDLGTSLDATTTAMNIFAADNLSAEQAMDIFTATVNAGKTTLDELGPALADPAAAAAQAGIELDQVGASMAAMTAQGIGTSEAGTQLRSVINELNDSASQAGQIFEEVAGESFAAFIEGGGTVAEAAQLMAAEGEASGQTLSQMFSSVEASGAAFFLSTETGADTFADALGSMQSEASPTEDAFNNIADTGSFAMERLAGAAEQMQIGVGQALAPVILEFVDGLFPVIEELSPIITDVAGTAADMLGTILDAVLPLLPPLTNIVSQILPIMANLFNTLVSAAAPLIEILLNLLISIIEPLLPAIEPLLEIFGELAGTLAQALAPILEIIGEILLWVVEQIIIPVVVPIIEFLAELFAGVLGAAVEEFAKLFADTADALSSAFEWLADKWEEQTRAMEVAWALLQVAFQIGKDFIQNNIINPISNFFSDMGSTIGGVFDDVRSGFNSTVSFLKGIPGQIEGALRGLWEPIWEGFRDAINAVIRGWNNLSFTVPSVDLGPLGSVGGFTISTPNIPQLQTGGFTLGEGLVNLHPNEMVLPLTNQNGIAALAEALQQAGTLSVGGTGNGDITVIVKIGERELTEIVDFQVEKRDAALAHRVRAGSRGR